MVRSKARRARITVLLAMAILLLALIATGNRWLPAVGGFLMTSDPLVHADAVMPLVGDNAARPAYAAQLLVQGYADWFVTPNVTLHTPGIRESYADLVKLEASWQGVPATRMLVVPGRVETIYDEAVALRRFAEERGWRALIIVADPQQARRSQVVFRHVFRGTSITIIVRRLPEHWYQANSWWRSQAGLRETWMEYLMLALFLLGSR